MSHWTESFPEPTWWNGDPDPEEDEPDTVYWRCPHCGAVTQLTVYGDEGDVECQNCGYYEEQEKPE